MDYLKAAQVLWTAPLTQRGRTRLRNDVLSPIECLVAAISAHLWRMHSGPIRLYTDNAGYELICRLGLQRAWSEIDRLALSRISLEVDASTFWDFGKVVAISQLELPFALLDLDMIVWKPLETTTNIRFFHWEELEKPWYPPVDQVSVPFGFQAPDVDPSTRAANMALVLINDEEFRRSFVRRSKAYIYGHSPSPECALAALLFSTQRLFTLVAAELGLSADPFVPYIHRMTGPGVWIRQETGASDPLSPHQFLQGSPYTHLWGFKHSLRKSQRMQAEFAVLLLKHVANVAPELAQELSETWTRLASPA